MLECLKKGSSDPRLKLISNTHNFKLIVFENRMLTIDQVTNLVQKQNSFLHDFAVVNLHLVDSIFWEKDKLEAVSQRSKKQKEQSEDNMENDKEDEKNAEDQNMEPKENVGGEEMKDNKELQDKVGETKQNK